MTEQQTLSSIPAAHAWLTAQGYEITERSVRNHVDAGMLPAEKSRNGKIKQIRMLDLERYAKNHLQKASAIETDGHRTRMIKEQADKLELENNIKRGKYLDREAEEQRDAAILSGLRRNIENAAPDRLQAILAEILKLIEDQSLRAAIVARQPEWLQQDMDVLADVFDGFHGV